ncbi:MAG: complex I NDUFA9 subunit family protein [Betaproteobacteria bacterium]
MRRVLVLGGSGFVGRALCERLAQSHPALRLLVPTRRNAHGQAVRPLPNVDLVTADVHDETALARLVGGCDAVVNLIAILHGNEAAFERVHVALPQRIVAACVAAGVRRVVHVSALGVTADAPSRYLRSKAAGEAVFTGSGLAVTVLRPSVIFGAHDRFLNTFAQLQQLAPFMPLAFGGARFQPVWVGDVAAAIAAALDRPGTAGLVFECAGPREATLSELVRLAGQWAGVPRPQLPLPGWAGSLQALLMELMPGEPLMSRDNVASMSVPNVASGTLPGLAALGIAPTPLEAVAPGYLAERFGPMSQDRFRARRR